METFSALLAICAGNSPVTGEFPTQRPVTWSWDVFFDLRLNERLSKQPWGWWVDAPSRPLWRHCNDVLFIRSHYHEWLDSRFTMKRTYRSPCTWNWHDLISIRSQQWEFSSDVNFELQNGNAFWTRPLEWRRVVSDYLHSDCCSNSLFRPTVKHTKKNCAVLSLLERTYPWRVVFPSQRASNEGTEALFQNIKMLSYQCGKSHYGDKTVARSSYINNGGISYTR